MNPSSGFYATKQQDQAIYRCHYCPWTSFVESAAEFHAKSHPEHGTQFPDWDMPLTLWVNGQLRHKKYEGKKVVIGFLTWNSWDASMFAANSVSNEVLRLRTVGVDASSMWVDNGSEDGTVKALEGERIGAGARTLFKDNLGQSLARNEIIRHAISVGADYLVMLDGDVQMIPWSAFGCMDYLEQSSPKVGCIGFYTHNHAPQWDDCVASDCRRIYPEMASRDSNIAWTQYGMFRVSMFKDGIMFDDNEVFCGPGWGLEDDDLWLQMVAKGYECHHTKRFRHIHRHRSSSIDKIGRAQVQATLDRRKHYLAKKWGITLPHWIMSATLVDPATS